MKARVIKNLRDNHDDYLFSAHLVPGLDRDKAAEQLRKSRERIKKNRKEALEISALEAESLRRLAQDAKYEESLFNEYKDIAYDTPTPLIDKPKKH